MVLPVVVERTGRIENHAGANRFGHGLGHAARLGSSRDAPRQLGNRQRRIAVLDHELHRFVETRLDDLAEVGVQRISLADDGQAGAVPAQQFAVIIGPEHMGFGFPAHLVGLRGNVGAVDVAQEDGALADSGPITVPVVAVAEIGAEIHDRVVVGRSLPLIKQARHQTGPFVAVPCLIAPNHQTARPVMELDAHFGNVFITGVQPGARLLVVLKNLRNGDISVGSHVQGAFTGAHRRQSEQARRCTI